VWSGLAAEALNFATPPSLPHPGHDDGEEDASDDYKECGRQPDRAAHRPSGARLVNSNEGDRRHR